MRPGLLLANPERITKDDIPEFLNKWEVIYSTQVEGLERFYDEYLKNAIRSAWIDMNLFSIEPETVVVDSDQKGLIRLLESKSLNVIPVKLRHSRMLARGFHCVTLDTKRSGELATY